MASKYEEVLKRLQMAPEEPKYQAKVDSEKELIRSLEPRVVFNVPEFKQALLGKSTVDISRLYAQVREHRDLLESELSTVNLMLKALTQMGTEGFMAEGVKSISVRDFGSVASEPQPIAQIVDHSKFIDWVKANGYENSLTLYAATVTKIVKERLLEGLGEPDGVKAYFQPKLVFRRG